MPRPRHRLQRCPVQELLAAQSQAAGGRETKKASLNLLLRESELIEHQASSRSRMRRQRPQQVQSRDLRSLSL